MTGDSRELKSDENLRMPPMKDGNVRYDTVNGSGLATSLVSSVVPS